MKNIFVFIPDTLKKDDIGLLEGSSKDSHDNLSFYITNDKVLRSSLKCIGYCSENSPEQRLNDHNNPTEWIHINSRTNEIRINSLRGRFGQDNKVISVIYDYNAFRSSNIASFKYQTYGEHFETLARFVQGGNAIDRNEGGNNNNNYHNVFHLMIVSGLSLVLFMLDVFLEFYRRFHTYFDYSATAIHLNTNIATLQWALLKIKREKRMTLNVGNTIVSKIVDFTFGIMLLYFVLQYESEFVRFIRTTTESIICSLEELLNFLMGSPVGLKLNYAFNKTLGTFFLYHISLWRAFLHAASPLLRFCFHFLIIPGAFGLSFQAALISDLVAFSTFHVYCIYVYAARLYGVQIRGLVSLWRLFIGRKYNPLRERVDSHQYTHHQLFIGTLGFTVLLFLLPTTFLYYAVFTVFRICLIALNGILIRVRYVLQCLPLYVSFLWATNSSSIKGVVKLTLPEIDSDSTVYATLETLSLWQSIINGMPQILTELPSVSLSLLFHSLAAGLLL